MAKQKKYVVVHSVRHDGKPYLPGESIEPSEAEALRLQSFGAVKEADLVVVVQTPFTPLSPSTLSKLTVDELIEHGNASYGLALSSELKKEALVEAITTAVTSRRSDSADLDSFTALAEGAGIGARV